MRKLQFCSGGLAIPGWESFDMDVDITKPLPFGDECASHIHCEHGLEHVTHQQAWTFLEECHRVLMPWGRIRVAIPDIEKISFGFVVNPSVAMKYQAVASPQLTRRGAIKAVVFNHGHKAAWTFELLSIFLTNTGFGSIQRWRPGESDRKELRGIEVHWKTVGCEINDFETAVAEASREA